MGRHGTGRVAKAVLLGAIPPLMLKTDANPEGLPIEVFDEIRAGVAGDRSQFYQDLSRALLRRQPARRQVSQGQPRRLLADEHAVGLKGAYDCIKAFSETDFTEDLQQIDVPVLVAHGDDDQIVPIAASAPKTAELLKDADAEGLPRRAARPDRRARRGVQRRPARLRAGLRGPAMTEIPAPRPAGPAPGGPDTIVLDPRLLGDPAQLGELEGALRGQGLPRADAGLPGLRGRGRGAQRRPDRRSRS